MILHIGGKVATLGLVLAALITAFSAPRSEPVVEVPLEFTPIAVVLSSAREVPKLQAAVQGPVANPRYVLRATGYNSLESQTDSTPFITATGTRTRFGVVAVSRDLLGADLPYGSLVRIRDLGAYHTGNGVGAFQSMLDSQQLFVVEDTMHARKNQQIDVWFERYDTAVNWGVRKVEVEVVRYGHDGPELLPSAVASFDATPVFLASR